MGTESDANSQKRLETIDHGCIVKFRPIPIVPKSENKPWVGQFGFDWFREGDWPEPMIAIDSNNQENTTFTPDYNKIVGKYTYLGRLFIDDTTTDPDNPFYKDRSFGSEKYGEKDFYPQKLKEYYAKKCEAKIAGLKSPEDQYHIPWISLFYKYDVNGKLAFSNNPRALSMAQIRMVIDSKSTNIQHIQKIIIETPSKNILLASDEKKLMQSPLEIEGPFSLDQKNVITICLNRPLKRDCPIYAYATDDFGNKLPAGLIYVAECNPKTVKRVKICFVKVNSDRTNQAQSRVGNEFRKEINNLSSFLAQAFVIPDIKVYPNDFELKWNDPEKTYADNLGKNTPKGNVYLVYGTNKNETILDKYNSPIRITLGHKLERIFNKIPGNIEKYGKHYKIFFLDGLIFDKISDVSRERDIEGFTSENGSKSAVISINHSDSVVCHELLHCIGLEHSFSNKNIYTYEAESTSNIMDYNQDSKYNQCISLWHWQWVRIRELI